MTEQELMLSIEQALNLGKKGQYTQTLAAIETPKISEKEVEEQLSEIEAVNKELAQSQERFNAEMSKLTLSSEEEQKRIVELIQDEIRTVTALKARLNFNK